MPPEDIAAAAVTPAVEVAPSAPVGESVSSTPATSSPATAEPATSGSPDATASPSSPEAGAKPANEFQPSLLDSAAAKPDSAQKPAEAAPEGTPAGDKPADAKTDAPGETPPAPVEYKFTFPEGFDPSVVNSERMTAYTGLLGESKIPPEVGQKLLDLHLNEARNLADTIAQKQWDVFNETQNKWRKEVMEDPVLGQKTAEGKMPAIDTIMDLVNLYGGNAEDRKGLLDAFRITGAANNPHVLRFMHRAAKALAEEGKPHSAPPPRSVSADPRERRMNSRYGNTTPVQPSR